MSNDGSCVNQWGLDPLWMAHAAVFAAQILKEPYVEGMVGVIRCGSRAVHQMSVLGTVVEMSTTAKAIHFEVDDGSAVLGCVWWRTDIIDAVLDVGACLDMLQLGAAVTVWGHITTYKANRQLTVHHVAVEQDPHAEAARWLRIVDLMEGEYAASPLQHRSSLLDHLQTDMVLDPFAQSILANVQSQQQQSQQQSVPVSQPDAFADFKESWNFPAVSLAEVLSDPEGTHHDVCNVSESDKTVFLPQMTMQDLATSIATSTAPSAPTQDDTGALLDVLRASLA